MKTKSVVLLSGGLDSSVLAFRLRNAGHEVLAVSFRYGQKHDREIGSAEVIAGILNTPHRVLDLRSVGLDWGNSSLTNESVPIPFGHYEDSSMRATVVPGRNLVMIAMAASVAISSGADGVFYAAHGGDHAVYPDCRPTFVSAADFALAHCDYKRVTLEAPFQTWRKEDVVREGDRLGVPFGITWSCYLGGERHCGLCGTCVERKEAFLLAGVIDPTEYEKGM